MLYHYITIITLPLSIFVGLAPPWPGTPPSRLWSPGDRIFDENGGWKMVEIYVISTLNEDF